MSDSQKFLKKASLFMVIDNVSKIMEPFLKLSCAKYFVGGSWGSFIFLESLVLMLIRFCLLGLDKGAIWSHGQLQDDQAYIRRFSKSFGFVALLTSFIAFIAFFFPIDLIPNHQNNAMAVGTFEQVAMLMAIPFQALSILLLQALICRENLSANIMVKNIILPMVTFATPLVLFFLIPNLNSLPYCYLLAQILGFSYAAIVFSKTYWDYLHHWSFIPIPEWIELKFSLPMSLSDFLNSVVMRVDNVLLMNYAGVHGVEIYSIAILISKSFLAVRESFDNVVLKLFSKSETVLFSDEKKNTFNYVNWFVISVQLPIFMFALVFGESILNIWEPKYLESYPIILITSLLLIASVPGAISSSLLVGLGKSYFILVVQTVFFISIVGLNLIFIPQYGAIGAGIAFGLATLAANMVSFFSSSYFSKSLLFDPKVIKSYLITLAIYAPSLISMILFRESRWLQISLLVAASLLMYLHFKKGMKTWQK